MIRLAASRIYSRNHFYLLEKELSAPDPRQARPVGPLKLELVREHDLAAIEAGLSSLNQEDRREILARLFFYWNGFRNCYLLRSGGEIAALAWILFPEDNERLQRAYPGKFLPLVSGQVMIENVFTYPRFRSKGMMRYAVGSLLGAARSREFASAVCYIRKDRLNSLNGFISMGFRLRKIMPEYKFLGQEARLW